MSSWFSLFSVKHLLNGDISDIGLALGLNGFYHHVLVLFQHGLVTVTTGRREHLGC